MTEITREEIERLIADVRDHHIRRNMADNSPRQSETFALMRRLEVAIVGEPARIEAAVNHAVAETVRKMDVHFEKELPAKLEAARREERERCARRARAVADDYPPDTNGRHAFSLFATEFLAPPASSDEVTASPARVERHMDEIDAGIALERALDAACAATRGDLNAQVERYGLRTQQGQPADGGVVVLWSNRTIAFAGLVVRDEMNFSVAVFHPAVTPAEPAWTPTHRHYKGGLYREIGRGTWAGNDANGGKPTVQYDNETGERYDMLLEQWQGTVWLRNGGCDDQSSVRRYEPINETPAEPSAPAHDICQACDGSGVGVADTRCSRCDGSGAEPSAPVAPPTQALRDVYGAFLDNEARREETARIDEAIAAVLDAHLAWASRTGLKPSKAIAVATARERLLRIERPSIAALEAENAKLREGLGRIERWHGEFPDTGRTWPDGSPMSYAAQFGSNGERDYMREIARALLQGGAP